MALFIDSILISRRPAVGRRVCVFSNDNISISNVEKKRQEEARIIWELQAMVQEEGATELR